MYQIPSGKGIISKETQRSGKTYYYIRNLPLYCDDQGRIIKFRSKGFTLKEEAEAERKRMIVDRDNGLYKYHFIEVGHVQQSSNKKVPTGANQSYYDFCIDYFTKATYAEATRKPVSYTHLDVYKRQDFDSSFTCAIFFISSNSENGLLHPISIPKT